MASVGDPASYRSHPLLPVKVLCVSVYILLHPVVGRQDFRIFQPACVCVYIYIFGINIYISKPEPVGVCANVLSDRAGPRDD